MNAFDPHPSSGCIGRLSGRLDVVTVRHLEAIDVGRSMGFSNIRARDALLLFGFVVGSSWLAATRGQVWRIDLFIWAWSESVWASLFFTLGSIWAAVFAYEVARGRGFLASVGVSLASNFGVYTVSLALLFNGAVSPSALLALALAAVVWGFAGLIFAALAPAITWRVLSRREVEEDPLIVAASAK